MEVLSNASQSEPWSFVFYIGVSGQATSLEGTCEINCRGESIVRSLRHVGARTVAFQDGQTSQAWQHVRELGDVFGSVYYPSKDLESALLNGPVSMPSMVLGGACGAILKGLVELEGSQEFIFAGELHTKGRMDVWSISQKEGQYSIHRERCCMARVNEGEPLEPSEKFKQLRSGLSIVGPGNCKPGRARLSSLLIGIGVASLTWSERDELRWKGAVVNPGDTLRWSRGGWQLVPALRAVVK